MPAFERLQEKNISSYERAMKELKDTNKELYFYTPRHRVTVEGILTIDWLDMHHIAYIANMM